MAYEQYARWQQSLWRDPDTSAARAYWSERPRPDASRFRLPFAREARPPRELTIASFARQFDEDLSAELRSVAAEARVDLSTLLLAAYQAVLWRHLETHAIEVGVRLDGRSHPSLRDVPGPCARYVPVELEIAPGWPLGQLARRTAAIVREHRSWQDCFAWDALGSGAGGGEDLSYCAFGYEWRSSHPRSLGAPPSGSAPRFRLVSLEGMLDRFDVHLTVTRAGRRIDCAWMWNTAQYDERDIAGLADRYRELLVASVRQPGQRLVDLDIVPAVERDALISQARGPVTAPSSDSTIHQRFEAHAARNAAAIAVIDREMRLTYGDLDRRATALAARLQAAGVAPGDRIAIALPRTAAQLVAVFGVLKTGAAFLPLDPAVPWERLAWTVTDARVSILIAPPEAAGRVPPETTLRIVSPDSVSTDGEAADVSFVAPTLDPAASAYVIYTSGSTGRPKGVIVSHRGLLSSTDARSTHYREPVGSFLLVSPLAFDSAMAGVFWTLTTGGALIIPSDEEYNDPTALRRLIEEHGVTHVLCLPSLYAHVLDTDRAASLHSLRAVIVAGERCASALADRHRAALPAVALHNEYGPTECSVWSTVYTMGTANESAGIPIGRPVARTELHVAERPWRLAPRGIAAEALIGGAGVADGYLGRPDLTAERFVPDVWSGRSGARVYRTGDRVRWDAAGQIEFLGRVDHQVKIRGYRIELEEIEAAIGAHGDVRECVVAVQDAAGGERLVAYVVPQASATDAAVTLIDRLRRFLGERLPVYMLPAVMQTLDTLPKTPNGKVDRARLPAIQAAADAGPTAHPPTTETEQVIAQMWQDALGREQIGIHDNFFDLGGHSLMAITIFARLRGALAPGLRLIDLFDRPTVHTLAAFVDSLQPAAGVDAAAATEAIAAEAAATDTAVVESARTRQQALRRKRLEVRAS
jgi:amino acid adenylation domain-containing protein